MSLKIADIVITPHAGFELRQAYDVLQARHARRSMDGTLRIQSRWQKLQSSISGSGWVPDGLDGLDTSVILAVACIQPLSKDTASNVITIPRVFRVDAGYAPQGIAIVNDEPVPTPLSLAANVATLTPVASATRYQVMYYPIITGMVSISRQFDEAGSVSAWTIEVEEA